MSVPGKARRRRQWTERPAEDGTVGVAEKKGLGETGKDETKVAAAARIAMAAAPHSRAALSCSPLPASTVIRNAKAERTLLRQISKEGTGW
jgi:hypothetical protein